jgi:hypothetical protein
LRNSRTRHDYEGQRHRDESHVRFLSLCYFVPTNDRLAAIFFGNLRYDFGSVVPMSGFTELLSSNLGDSEARCGFS